MHFINSISATCFVVLYFLSIMSSKGGRNIQDEYNFFRFVAVDNLYKKKTLIKKTPRRGTFGTRQLPNNKEKKNSININLKFLINIKKLININFQSLPQAWDLRDQAVARKNACAIELARTRIDLMTVNSQLLEAITQKVELSQQLDQWQVNRLKTY